MHCKMNESLRSVARAVKYFLCIYTKEVTFTLWFYEGLYIYLVLIDKKMLRYKRMSIYKLTGWQRFLEPPHM